MHSNIAGAENVPEVLDFSLQEAHPPFYYVMLHYWMKLSSLATFVRGFSLLCGLLSVVLYYFIGKKLNGDFTGLCCAVLIGFSQGFIIQSYLVRHYALMLLLLSLAFYCYLFWRDQPGKFWLLAYGFCALLACMTHFSAIFGIVCIALFETVGFLRRKRFGAEFASWVFAKVKKYDNGGDYLYLALNLAEILSGNAANEELYHNSRQAQHD